MFYSHSIENERINLFTSFIKSAIEGRDEYRAIINKVIEETHALAAGEKDFYSINRDTYPIVVFLEEKDNNFFKNINTANINKTIYNKILNILSEPRMVSQY